MTRNRTTMAPLDRGGGKVQGEVDWETLREEVLDGIDLLAVAEECGFQSTGDPTCEWVRGRAFNRNDNTPSASFNRTTGIHYDHAEDESTSIYDMLVEAGRAEDYWDAFRQLAEKAGVPVPGGGKRSDPPVTLKTLPKFDATKPAPELRKYDDEDAAIAAVLRNLPCEDTLAYQYPVAEGEVSFSVIKGRTVNGDKFVRQVSRRGDKWVAAGPDGIRPLYELPSLCTAEERATVYVTEGEKDCETLRKLGLLATTSAGGASAAKKTDWTPLAGRDVVILPDHDSAGRNYAADVVGQLSKLTPGVTARVIDPKELFDSLHAEGLVEGEEPPAGWDVSDAAAGPKSEDNESTESQRRGTLRRLIEEVAAATPVAESDTEPANGSAPLTYRPFPIEALPPLYTEIVRDNAIAIGCAPALIATPLLAMTAGAIGSVRRAGVKEGYSEPAVMFAATIGKSGGHKSPAADCVMNVFRELQREKVDEHRAAAKQFKRERANWEARAKRARGRSSGAVPSEPDRPVLKTYYVSDATTEAVLKRLVESGRGLFCFIDELSGWFGMMDRYAGKGGGDMAKWLEFFGGRDARVDRKTGDDPVMYVPFACVSLFGTTQPGVLRSTLGSQAIESGLAARFCFAFPPPRVSKWSDAQPNPQLQARLRGAFEALLSLESEDLGEGRTPQPVVLPLSPAARRLFRKYYDRVGVAMAGAEEAAASAFSKARGYAVRFALIHHLAAAADPDCRLDAADRRPIQAVSMRSGIEIAEWYRNEFLRVLELLHESKAGLARRKSCDFVRRNGGAVTVRELQGARRDLTTAADAEAVLEDLVKQGLGSWRDRSTTAKGGRPTREFALHGDDAVKAELHEGSAEPCGESVRTPQRVGGATADPFAKEIPDLADDAKQSAGDLSLAV